MALTKVDPTVVDDQVFSGRRLNINASITSINLGNGLLHKKILVFIFFLKKPGEELLIILPRELEI